MILVLGRLNNPIRLLLNSELKRISNLLRICFESYTKTMMMTKTKILLHAIRPVYVYIEVFGVMDDQIVQCSMKMNLDVSRYFIIINNDDDHDKIFVQF